MGAMRHSIVVVVSVDGPIEFGYLKNRNVFSGSGGMDHLAIADVDSNVINFVPTIVEEDWVARHGGRYKTCRGIIGLNFSSSHSFCVEVWVRRQSVSPEGKIVHPTGKTGTIYANGDISLAGFGAGVRGAA